MDKNKCYNCTMKTSIDNDWHWCNQQRSHTSEVKKCNKVTDESRYRQKEP